MTPSFTFADTFPVIEKLIVCNTPGESFITHSALVDEILSSAEGSALVKAAVFIGSLDERHVAITMMAWFSQQFTIGRNPYCGELERQRVDGKWAYRKAIKSPNSKAGAPSEATSNFSRYSKSGEMVPFEEVMKAWDEELAEEATAPEVPPAREAPTQREIVEMVMKRMRDAPKLTPDPLGPARREAFGRHLRHEDFFEIATNYKISTRTLLAWLDHEGAKWESDLSAGRDPGPGVDYCGEWPDQETEMEHYANLKLPPDRFESLKFQNLYRRYLASRGRI